MIPSHLQVFDGLRITTAHVEHLQAAFETSIRDLRAIAGLGQVLDGFEVTATGPNQLSVGPGLAFDPQANRLASDAPQVLELAAENDATEWFVCIRYEQVQAGEVEGVPTLVFDSAAASLEPATPDPSTGDQIVIARVARQADDESVLVVEDLRRGSGSGPKPDTDTDAEPEPESGAGSGSEPDTGAGANLPPETDAVTPAEPAPGAEAPAASGVDAPGGQAPTAVARRLLDQGVVHAAPGADAAVGPWLRAALERGDTAPEMALAEAALEPSFAPTSMRVSVVTNLRITWLPPTVDGSSDPVARDEMLVHTVSEGDVLIVGGAVRQQGLTTADVVAGAGAAAGAATPTGACISADAIGRVPVGELLAGRGGSFGSVGPLSVDVFVVESDDGSGAQRLHLSLCLSWEGVVSEDALRSIEEVALEAGCEAVIAWKAEQD